MPRAVCMALLHAASAIVLLVHLIDYYLEPHSPRTMQTRTIDHGKQQVCALVAWRVANGLLQHVAPICAHIVSRNLFVWKHTSVVPALVLSMCRIAVLRSYNSSNAGDRFRFG